jgi:hypothetical protein
MHKQQLGQEQLQQNADKPEPKGFSAYYSIIKLLVLIFSYGFLIYQIAMFDDYKGLNKEFNGLSFLHFRWLMFVLLMIPFNWLFEVLKWRFLCSSFEKMSFKTGIKSVLAGLTPGFFSPNRIGELLGRSLFLKSENRISGILMAGVGGFAQTIVIVACGIPSAIFFFFNTTAFSENSYKYYTYFCLFWLISFLFFYAELPGFCRWLSQKKMARKLKTELETISEVPVRNLMLVLFYSLVRYVIFCFQLYFLLFFCGISISPIQALIAITLNYLFVAITPSIAFSESAIRSSFAILFIGYYSTNTIGVASAGVLLWMLNFVIPMIIGSFFFAKTKI